mgnify:CR=1 FL=1
MHRIGVTVGAALVALLAGAASGVAADQTSAPEPNPAASSAGCEAVEASKATLSMAGDRVDLQVSGSMPWQDGIVRIVRPMPVIYVMQPDYWAIDLLACPAADSSASPAASPGRFEARFDVTAYIGSRGIVLHQSGGSELRLDVPRLQGG